MGHKTQSVEKYILENSSLELKLNTLTVFKWIFQRFSFSLFFFQQSLESWKIVFLITSAIYIVGNTIFIIFLQTDVQKWNTYWEKSQMKQKSENDSKSQEMDVLN